MSSLRPLIDRLRRRYPAAAALVERWGDTSIDAYARALWCSKEPQDPIETELIAALRSGLAHTYGDDPRIAAALHGLEYHRTLGTTAHLAPSYGPVFLAADHLLALGAPAGTPALVAAWSALPFNNASRPGCVTFTGELTSVVRPRTKSWRRLQQSQSARAELGDHERRLSLVSTRNQRGLVYRHPLPERLQPTLDDLQAQAVELLGRAEGVATYPEWAIRSCARMQAGILDRPPLVVDLNRGLSLYFAEILRNSAHPLTRALLDPEPRAELGVLFPDAPWFLGRRRGPAGERLVPVVPEGDTLIGLEAPLPLTADALTRALEDGVLCPGLFLSYAALVGINGLHCVGGLRSSNYLPEMERRWHSLGWRSMASDRPNLLLGRLVDDAGRPAHALDLALADRPVREVIDEHASMARLWAPLTQLL